MVIQMFKPTDEIEFLFEHENNFPNLDWKNFAIDLRKAYHPCPMTTIICQNTNGF